MLPCLILISSALSAHDALSLADFPQKTGLHLGRIISNYAAVVNCVFIIILYDNFSVFFSPFIKNPLFSAVGGVISIFRRTYEIN